MTNAVVGSNAEQTIYHYLSGYGLSCICRNFRCKLGEIDLIMLDQDELVFVEVRYRRWGDGAESVDLFKQKKLCKTAEYFLQSNSRWAKSPMRFDVVALDKNDDIVWIKDAFQAAAW